MRISPDGSALIATVYPIGILVLAIESRAALAAALRLFPAMVQKLMAWVVVVVVAFSASAVIFCVQAVSADTTLEGFDFWFVALPGYLLGICVSVALSASLMDLSRRDPS